MPTPPCRCVHPSHYHGGGSRPWPCDVASCDCPDFWPTDEDISRAKADAIDAVEQRLVPPQHRRP